MSKLLRINIRKVENGFTLTFSKGFFSATKRYVAVDTNGVKKIVETQIEGWRWK